MATQSSIPADFTAAAPEPWLDSRQAAAVLKINHKTLERYAREGRIPGYQHFSRWYFRRSELDAWLGGKLQSVSQSVRVN